MKFGKDDTVVNKVTGEKGFFLKHITQCPIIKDKEATIDVARIQLMETDKIVTVPIKNLEPFTLY